VYTCDEFEQALFDTHDHMSLVPETQLAPTYPQDTKVRPMSPLHSLVVDEQHLADATLNDKHKAIMVGKARTTCGALSWASSL
jgi:hypothetical protein